MIGTISQLPKFCTTISTLQFLITTPIVPEFTRRICYMAYTETKRRIIAYEERHTRGYGYMYEATGLDDRGLGARLERVGQAALAAVLAVLVESHLQTQVST